MKIKAKLNFKDKDLIKNCGLDKKGRVQMYIDNFVMTRSDDYTPGKHINDNARSSTKIGEGRVIWNSPDANYLYDGRLMVDPITLLGAFPIRGGKISFNEKDGEIEGFVSRKGNKIMDPKGRNLKYHGGGKRGDHWFDRMIEENMDDLLNGVVKEIEANDKH